MHEKYTQAKENELKILNFLLYEKSGETVLKTSTRKDQSSTSFPLSSICLNGPFYCFELVIRRPNSVIILYFFFFLGPFRGSVAREVGTGVRDYLVSELLRPVILFRLSMSKCIYYTQVTPN